MQTITHRALSLLTAATVFAGAAAAQNVMVFNNTAIGSYHSGGMTCSEGAEVGDEVVLASGPRNVVEVGVHLDSTVPLSQFDLRLRIYANDGAAGEPGTLLYTGQINNLECHGGFYDPEYVFPVPNVPVPGTITCTLEPIYHPGTQNGSLKWSNFDPPVVGASGDFSWGRDPAASNPGWVQWNAPAGVVANVGFYVVTNPEGPGVTTFCDPADANSTGLPTRLEGVADVLAPSGLHLEVNQGPVGQFGYVLVGTGVQDPGVPVGSGHLCLASGVGNQIGRYNLLGPMNSLGLFDGQGVLQNLVGNSHTGSGFDVPSSLPLTGSPAITQGQTWHFQAWFREAAGASNFTNGLSVTF
ncbi:MAG: hypothetical protein R3F17_16480 [Planctomycetota bacterium]